MEFDYIVVGRGLIGSAAARYLSRRCSVALISPRRHVKAQTQAVIQQGSTVIDAMLDDLPAQPFRVQ